ncbi:MAG: hypothetical protein AAFY98_06265 [Verrucomicrobiota bacterium]
MDTEGVIAVTRALNDEEPFDFLKKYAQAVPHEIDDGLELKVVTLGTLIGMKKDTNSPRGLEESRALKQLYGI